MAEIPAPNAAPTSPFDPHGGRSGGIVTTEDAPTVGLLATGTSYEWQRRTAEELLDGV